MARRDVTVRLPTLDQIVPPANRETLLRHLALLLIGRIKRRTGQGKDVTGAPLAPYSARYAKQRLQAGMNAAPVALTLSGATMASMQIVQSSPAQAVIGFVGSSAAMSLAKRKRALRGTSYEVREKVGGVWVTRKKGAVKATHTFKQTNRQVANALKARWNDKGDGPNPRRHFFGVSAEDKAFLAKYALAKLLAMARRISLNRALRR